MSRPSPLGQALMRRIDRRRRERRISCCELAILCGVHRNTLSRLNADEASISVDFLWLASEALEVSPSQLLQEAMLDAGLMQRGGVRMDVATPSLPQAAERRAA